jgi:hypothetical protein
MLIRDSFTFSVAGVGVEDAESDEEASRALRKDLADVDDVRVHDVSGESVPGTRSAWLDVATAMIVTYYGGKTGMGAAKDIKKFLAAAVPSIAGIIHDWSSRHPDKRAVVTLRDGSTADLTNLTPAEIEAVLKHVALGSQADAVGTATPGVVVVPDPEADAAVVADLEVDLTVPTAEEIRELLIRAAERQPRS